jgi:Zn-dependent peptidase ImmA (M78 family)
MAKSLNIEKAATEFRQQYGFNTTNPIRLKSLLLQLKVLTVYKDMDTSFSGMSLKIDDQKFMLINSHHPIGRQHFTICHEIYHLYVQKDFEHVICDDNTDPKEKIEETNADIFAANLMLPREGVLKFIPEEELKKDKISIKTVLEIEQYFACSHQALLRRLINLDLISEKKAEELQPDIMKRASEYGYDTALYKSGNNNLVIGDYGVKAKELFDKDIISQTHYIELMRDIGVDLENPENNNDEK